MKIPVSVTRAIVALGMAVAVTSPMTSSGQTASAEDIAKLQESIQAMRSAYEQRINALEQKIATLEQQTRQTVKTPSSATTPSTGKTDALLVPTPAPVSTPPTSTSVAAAAPASNPHTVSSSSQPSLSRGIALPKIGAFTPEIELILDGKYSAQSQNPESLRRGFIPSGGDNVPRGFSLGESEFAFAGTVDNLFRAEARLVLSQNGTDFNVALEEAFFETLDLPVGLKVKGGKFFSNVGYLNNKHPHEWDFVDLPLAYQAFFGGQLNNTGGQLAWIAPFDTVYLRLGAEIGQGMSYPTGNNFNENRPRLGTLFAKLGSDVGRSSSWQGGLSYVGASTGPRPSISALNDTDAFSFSGDTNILIADFVYKWSPKASQSFKLQGEAFWNTKKGISTLNTAIPYGICESSSCTGNRFSNTQSGFYVQGIYQFMRNWRVGYRFDQLYSGNPSYGFGSGTFTGTSLESWNPTRNTIMLDWANSENSMLRLQLATDTSYGPGKTNNQVFLQYIMSLGAHGAHRF
ncbi:MAG: hypothetical protein RLZZ192_179 [Pseudomonadota bacterium]|jgi:type II secretory pathway pseudopilin PulG